MASTQIVALLGVIAALAFGVSDFLAAKASRSVGAIWATFFVNVITAVVFIEIFALVRLPFHFSVSGYLFAGFGGVLITVGQLLLFVGLQRGPVSLVSPVSSTYPLLTTILATAVFGAQITGVQVLGIGLAVVGVAVTTYAVAKPAAAAEPGEVDAHETAAHRSGVLAALGAVLAWGVGFALLAQGVSRLGWQSAMLVQLCSGTVALVVALYVVVRTGRLEPLERSVVTKALTDRPLIGAALLALAAFLVLNIGLMNGKADGAVVVAISATYPIVTVALALYHFREIAHPVRLAGVLLSVCGIVVLSLG